MFTQASQVRRRVKCALWGPFKEGKTSFGLSFPGPIAALDSEKGTILYSDRYQFDVEETIRWNQLPKAINFLRANPGKYATLLIDSLTPIYGDLIDEVTALVQQKRGADSFLQQADWGIIKRRFKAFVTALLELDMNVVVTMRAKDEYEDTKNAKTGNVESKKTGQMMWDVERSAGYLFDFIVRCSRIKNVKTKKVQYFATIEGSRVAELPMYTEFDITNKKGYDVVFKPLEKKLNSGSAPTQTAEMEAEAAAPETTEQLPRCRPAEKWGASGPGESGPAPADNSVAPAGIASLRNSPEVQIPQIMEHFGAEDEQHLLVDNEDLKVLYTRAGDVNWPDGTPLKSEDAKALMKFLFNVESGKELKKWQMRQLYHLFGGVAAGHHELQRTPDGRVDIQVNMENCPF